MGGAKIRSQRRLRERRREVSGEDGAGTEILVDAMAGSWKIKWTQDNKRREAVIVLKQDGTCAPPRESDEVVELDDAVSVTRGRSRGRTCSSGSGS